MKKLLDILKLAGIWLTLFGLWACVGWDSRDLNPAIFPAFRAIENQCLAERWPHETVRCERVLEVWDSCVNAPEPCPATEYYENALKAGFDLPPLYLAAIH